VKKGLQIIVAILSTIPIAIGLLGITLGTLRWLPENAISPDFDSHYRYIAGYYLSLGTIGFWMIPQIERHRDLFRIVCFAVFSGGVGRVISIFQVGVPSPPMLVFTAFELCFPLLLLWQAKIPRT
jgi:hypothetical protein